MNLSNTPRRGGRDGISRITDGRLASRGEPVSLRCFNLASRCTAWLHPAPQLPSSRRRRLSGCECLWRPAAPSLGCHLHRRRRRIRTDVERSHAFQQLWKPNGGLCGVTTSIIHSFCCFFGLKRWIIWRLMYYADSSQVEHHRLHNEECKWASANRHDVKTEAEELNLWGFYWRENSSRNRLAGRTSAMNLQSSAHSRCSHLLVS